jgi:hypothetical protein
MSKKDMCVCKHAFDKHDDDGECGHDCDACAANGFRLDARSSPELTEADVIALLSCFDQDDAELCELVRVEIILGKVAFQIFGLSLDKLRERQQKLPTREVRD